MSRIDVMCAFFLDAEKHLDGVKIFHTHSCKIPLGASQPAVIYRPNSAVFKPHDITHIHGLTSYSCVLGCLSKRVNRTRLVTRSDLSQEGYALLKNNAAWRSIFFKLFRSIDAVYAYTELEKAVLVDVGIPEDDIWVVPLGVRLEQFYESVSREDAGHTLTIGYIGRFDWMKGVHRLVEPLSKILREYEFVRVAFAGPKHDVRYANNVLSRMRALPNFSYLGRPAETPPFYQRCDIIVIPSLYDTGTIVALELWLRAKLLLHRTCRPLNEYLEHGVSALLVETEEEIYSYCKRLIEDADLRAKLGAAARKESSKYSDLAMIRKLEQVYACVTER